MDSSFRQWSFNFFQKKKKKEKKHMFGKNQIKLWSKNLETNQNTGFCKLEYLRNKLRYQVEFLDVNRGP